MRRLPDAEPPARPGGTGRYLDLAADKLRGGYYTPPDLATWLCAWALRDPEDAVLEPSCGDGAFLAAAAARLAGLGARAPRLLGVELAPAEATAARARLRGDLGPAADAAVVTDDFFAWWQRPGRPAFDAVVGNPPFIRYQTFPEPCRTRAGEILEGLGLRTTRLTNVWVPFVAAAAACLRPGGRLALVLPAELLQVSYAAPLREHLAARFARLHVVGLHELCFPDAEQEVVLLLAEGAAAGGPARLSLVEAAVRDLAGRPPAALLEAGADGPAPAGGEKWLQGLLDGREAGLLRALRGPGGAATLAAHAEVDVGIVTGRNAFFVLGGAAVRARGLGTHTVPVVSRAAQLRGAAFDAADWAALDAGGADRVHLLHLAPLRKAPPGPDLAAYLDEGARQGVPAGYKCSIRSPWWAVPSVWVPDAFLLRQIHAFPRAVLNRGGATATDTLHRVRCRGPADRLVAALHTSLTAASAELEGRSYGGGVLELEPSEAERLLVPPDLGPGLPLAELDRLVRAGRLADAVAENDRLVLRQGMGLADADVARLRGIAERLRGRRLRRGGRRPISGRQVPSRGSGTLG